MLVSRTADSCLNWENECASCQFDLEVQDKHNWIPSGRKEHLSGSEPQGDADHDAKWSVQNEERAETSRVETEEFRVPHDVR